jgi:hypothetical protein
MIFNSFFINNKVIYVNKKYYSVGKINFNHKKKLPIDLI